VRLRDHLINDRINFSENTMTTPDNSSLQDPNDVDLDYTQGMRRRIVNSLTEKGIPDSLETLSMLTGVLSDMDRSSLGRKRLKTDEKMGDAAAAAQAIISTLFDSPGIKTLGQAGARTLQPVLEDGVITYIPSAGETDPLTKQEDFESFNARIRQEAAASRESKR
jgi:hypothetical protein